MTLRERLSRYADGVHRLGEPAYVLDAGLPRGLVAVFRELDGAELFHEALVLVASTQIEVVGDRVRVGEVDGDELFVHRQTGAVWRLEKDSEDWLEEGSAIDRWLAGWIDAQEVLFDDEGEYHDNVFDDDGELEPAAACAFERRLLKRDKAAPAPRWRLARALVRRGEREAARDELETVVQTQPRFVWAWYDLGRLSESLGDLTGAADELREAAGCDPTCAYAGFFWAHAARVAAAAGDEAGRREAAARALERSAELVRVHREAAAASLADDDQEAAREHVALALALAPRDLEVLELSRQIAAGATAP